MQQHAASFLARTEANTGSEMPHFIKNAFGDYLLRGILAHRFLRLRYGERRTERLLASSRKRRAFCPSCAARRMTRPWHPW